MAYLKKLRKWLLTPFAPKLVEVLSKGYSTQKFKNDCLAGLTTTVVSIPLSMALAIASGVSPAQGLYTAIIAGFLVSALGGSRYQIGGPTGAFVVVIFSILQQAGFSGLAMTMLIAGLLLILAGFLRLGSYVRYIPYPVIIGFTSGIGILLISTQIKELFGLELDTVPTAFFPKWGAYLSHLNTFSGQTVLLSLLTAVLIFATKRYFPKLPAMLMGVVGATALVAIGNLSVTTIGSQFGALPHFLPKPTLPDFSLDLFFKMVPSGLTVAFLAALESLLSAKVVDGMSGDNHNPNAELIAQGIANIACIPFTGIPATGAIARTATNFKANAYSPVSGIMQSVFLLLFMLIFAPIAKYMPLCCLAVVLLLVAWNMLNVDKIWLMLKSPIGADKLILVLTLGLTVLVDLNTAISVGVVLSCILFMHRMSEEFGIEMDEKTAKERVGGNNITQRLKDQGVTTLRVSGPLFFGGVASVSTFLKRVDLHPKILILRMNQVPMIDASGVMLLVDLVKKLKKDGTKVILCHVRKQPRRVLHKAFQQNGLDWHTLSVAKNYTIALKIVEKFLKK